MQMYLLAKFQLPILKTFEVTTLQAIRNNYNDQFAQ